MVATRLTTINPDGSPHVTAVGAVWDGDIFRFQTADRTRKATLQGGSTRWTF